MHKSPENPQKITAKSPPALKTAPNPNKTHAEAQRPHGVLNIAHRDYPPHPPHSSHSPCALCLFNFDGQEYCLSGC